MSSNRTFISAHAVEEVNRAAEGLTLVQPGVAGLIELPADLKAHAVEMYPFVRSVIELVMRAGGFSEAAVEAAKLAIACGDMLVAQDQSSPDFKAGKDL